MDKRESLGIAASLKGAIAPKKLRDPLLASSEHPPVLERQAFQSQGTAMPSTNLLVQIFGTSQRSTQSVLMRSPVPSGSSAICTEVWGRVCSASFLRIARDPPRSELVGFPEQDVRLVPARPRFARFASS